MNLLILTPQLPYPPHQGTSLRNFHIIRGLAARHAITLLSFLEDNQSADAQANAPLYELCQQVVTVPVPQRSKGKRLWQMAATLRPDMEHRLNSRVFAARLKELLTAVPFDVVQVEGIELARYIAIVRAVSPQSKVVFDDHNAETELQRRNMQTDLANPRRWAAAAYSWVQVRRLARFETWACRAADAVTAVSAADAQHLQALVPDLQTPITVIPNCIDVEQYRLNPKDARPFDIVFSGKMDYRPNVDAVLWFAEEVWPQIAAQRPSTTWAIVGQKPHGRLEHLRGLPGITLTGWVQRVQPYLAGAQVIVMPFRVGSGTRLKLIEAMAAGKAIVSTPVGAEGFPVQHGREIWLAQTAAEMATAVLRLLTHPEERARLGTAAQEFARQYDWRVVVPRFETVYESILNEERGTGNDE
ncbi:MAG: glycosyltransferase [Anaerolineales bacterium]|nr:glycosyltransferase [Anaerolineales bacterium]